MSSGSRARDDRRIAVRTLCGSGERGFADGPGNLAKFDRPVGILALPDGRLIVADTFNHRIRIISTDGTVCTLAGSGAKGMDDGVPGSFHNCGAIATDGLTELIVADTCSHSIRSVNLADGAVTTVCGSGFEGPSEDASTASAQFNFPEGCAISPNGDLLIVDTDNDCIRAVRRRTQRVERISVLSGEQMDKPEGVLVLADDLVLVSDTCNNRLVTVCLTTGAVKHFAGSRSAIKGCRDGALDNALFRAPRGLAMGSRGDIVVADTDNDCLRVIDLQLQTVRTVDVELRGPFAVAVNNVGDFVVPEFDKNRVTVLSNKMHILKVWLMTSRQAKLWPPEVIRMLQNSRTI